MKTTQSGAVKDPLFFGLVHDFLKVYLPTQKGSSKHTIKSYKFALDALLDFVKAEKNIPLSAVTFEMIDRKALAAYLDSVEANGCGVVTRNHRLNSIRAFYKYAAKIEPVTVIHYDEIHKVPIKKSKEAKTVEYMSEVAVSAVLTQPDASTEKGLRDIFLMLLLYDTGARIQELMDLCLCDIRLGETPSVVFRGETTKSGKTREVPLTEKTVEHFRSYLDVFHQGESQYSAEPLFYVFRLGKNHKMHHDTARKMMFSYGVAAKQTCPEVPDNVHPHLWRHSRAMHLYQHGMDLTLVSQWLGHANLETTLIYAHADTEHKRRAIEAAVSDDSPLKKFTNAERFTIDDDEIIKRLYGLR